MSKKVVFIGGPIDGQRKMLDNRMSVYRVCERTPIPDRLPETPVLGPVPNRQHRYTERWYGVTCIFAHETLTDGQVWEQLAEYYRT